MNIADSFQNAIDYIEDHLTDEINYNTISQKACMSNFYFQRIFSVLCGYSVGDYIRYRRLTLAGTELSERKAKVIDVALKYGYETPESFTRAFKEFHGITPSQAKRNSDRLKFFSPLSVSITLRGGFMKNFKKDNYKIVKKDAFTVLEKVEQHTVDNDKNKNTIPEFWTRNWQDGTVKTLLGNMSGSKDLLGICYNNQSKYSGKLFDYAIGCTCAPDVEVPEGYRMNTIPARTWAVFDCVGPMPQAIQEAWHTIVSEFVPSCEYELTYEFDIEAYSAGNMTGEDYKSEIWVPIREKV